MATIPGSHFLVTAGAPVNVVETTTGTGLSAPVAGDFNLEVFVGNIANLPPLTPGYQGFAVLSPSGLEIDLISGTYAVTDNGTGNDTISAYGNDETISGGSANVTLNVLGSGDVANGGGQDTINVSGNSDFVHGAGNDSISVTGQNDQIYAGTGNDTISIQSNNDAVYGESGADTINVQGAFDTVFGGSASETISVSGHDDTVFAGSGDETITAVGLSQMVFVGSGNDTINLIGSGSSVFAGNSNDVVNLGGTHQTFVDQPATYQDTVVGFDQSNGDRIHLTTDSVSNAVANATPANGGADTKITLSDGSTILLKGVTHIDSSFFS
jgi:Ca2+-binding RTX toxin-like protein